MANFVRIGDSEYVINLDHVAYVEAAPKPTSEGVLKIYIVFTFTPDPEVPSVVSLSGDNAERFMAMLDRQTGVW